jgi:hypothetical protein
MVMEREEKTPKLNFASVAISFFILIMLPLTITGIIISKGVVKVGEEAIQVNSKVLDNSLKQAIENKTKSIAEAIAQFYTGREKDIIHASTLIRNEKDYAEFLNSNKLSVLNSKTPLAVYREIAFLDKTGKEQLKVTQDGVTPKDKLRDMSNPEKGEFGKEEYFDKAKILSPGEFYIGPVTGYHVNKQEFKSGKKFEGFQRIATPVFDSTGFAGVVELTLNYQHVREYVDHIIPTETEPGKIFLSVNPEDNNFAFIVDNAGDILSHPDETYIIGIDKNKKTVPSINENNYKTLEASGDGYLNLMTYGFKDENLPKIHEEASSGVSGSQTYKLGDDNIFVSFSPIPYYGNGFSKPKGPGWVGMFVDVNLHHKLNQVKVEEIKDKVAKWQKSTILVVIVSLILLFLIALILSRGIYRQIRKVYEEQDNIQSSDEDDKE